jgi:hypothetical protein
MRKGFLASFAGMLIAGGMAMAQAPAAPSALPDTLPAKDALPCSSTPTILNDCCLECADRPVCGPPGTFWVSAEYLYWWTKGSNLPNLVTGGSATDAIPGALGQPGTRVLFGGDEDSQGHSGARFNAGIWLNDSHTFGLEGSYFFLGSRSENFFTGASGAPGSAVITRPFLDVPPTGAAPFQNSEIVAFPGVAGGTVSVQSTSRLQGAAPDVLCNLCCCGSCCSGYRVDLIGGFSWFELNESVNINEDITPNGGLGSGFPPGSRIAVNDQFSTQNDFYGPQIGIRGEWWRDRFFVNARSSLAIGDSHESVSITGSTVFTAPGSAPIVAPGGLLALPSNIGNFSRDHFAVVPETGFNVGYQVTPHLRTYVGYTFMYWSSVVRPGDVIDGAVNPSQLPTIAGRGPLVGPANPAFEFHDSNFWAQGLNLGVELRY